MSETPKMKALVQWLGGEDDGKVDVVDVSWIKNFDPIKWKETPAHERSESEVIEWRKGKKSASGFYTCYDGKIINVSRSTSALKAEKVVINEKEVLRKTKPGTSQSGFNSSKKNLFDKSKSSSETDSSEDEVIRKEQGRNKERALRKTRKNGSKNGKIVSHDSDSSSPGSQDSDESEDEKKSSNAGKDKHKKKSRADANLFKKLKESSQRDVPKGLTKKAPIDKESEGKKAKKSEENIKVPIYKGSPYLVDMVRYNHSKLQGCANFVRAMLQELFPTKILVVSNLHGGKSKIDPDGFRRWALDKRKRLAITTATKALFPDVPTATIHSVIAKFINSLRLKLKRSGKLHRYLKKGEVAMKDVPHCQVSSDEDTSGDDQD